MPRLSAQQKTDRRLGIGSSDVAELLGLSPYEGASPVRIFAEKTGMLADDEDDEETIEQEVGHALEGALVRLYERKSGFAVLTVGEHVESVVGSEPWKRCNLDARIEGKRAALEVKVVGIGMAADWDLGDDNGIPNYVRIQVAWQMHVADLDEVHVVALIGGTGFRVFYVMRDLELEALIVGEAAAFWRLIVERKAPPLDASSASKAYLEKRYPPPAADVELEAPDDVVDIGIRRIRAAACEARACEAKEVANNELREAMGKAGATVMWCHSWRVTWKADKNGRRNLLVKPRGELAEPKVRVRKLNATDRPELDDGDAF